LPRPEGADLCLLENVVARKEFVRAFARKDDFVAGLAHQSRQQEHRRRSSTQQRRFAMPDHVGKDISDVLMTCFDNLVGGAEMSGHALLMFALVKGGVTECD
jgi:hypothetical protein